MTTVAVNINEEYYLAIIKAGFIDFDEFYIFEKSAALKKIEKP